MRRGRSQPKNPLQSKRTRALKEMHKVDIIMLNDSILMECILLKMNKYEEIIDYCYEKILMLYHHKQYVRQDLIEKHEAGSNLHKNYNLGAIKPSLEGDWEINEEKLGNFAYVFDHVV